MIMCAVFLGGGHRDEVREDAYVPKEEYSLKKSSEAESEIPLAAGGFVFNYNGTEVKVDVEADPVIEALGDYESYFESPSCAAQGIGKLYSYKDFEIETYPDGDIDRILYVRLKSDMAATGEGIDLSASMDDVRAAYGEPAEEKDSAMIYEKGGMKLKFIFDGDEMLSIEYDSPKV